MQKAPPDPEHDRTLPTTLYNGMIHPLQPYAIKGVIWYQGENNVKHDPLDYARRFSLLIGAWRDAWGSGDFPFYFAQLANFKPVTSEPREDDPWATLCDQQQQALTIPGTGMAVLNDIGQHDDIHFKNKFDVGNRLARWALARDYGQTNRVYSGPVFAGAEFIDGKVVLTFTSVAGGLIAGEKSGVDPVREVETPIKGFQLCGVDHARVWAEAVIISADQVSVHHPLVPEPVEIRYAWADHGAGANLYNRGGLPTSLFRARVPRDQAVLDTWILSGQSNAEGFGIAENPVDGLEPASTLEGIDRADLNNVFPQVQMFRGGTDIPPASLGDGVAPARDTWHAMTPCEGLSYKWGNGFGMESGCRFGPELSFADHLLRKGASQLAIIKFARGSTPIQPTNLQLKDGSFHDFSPGPDTRQNQYTKLIGTIRTAVTLLPSNHVLRIRGIFWMQGEADSKEGRFENYAKNLENLIRSLRRDMALVAQDMPGRLQPGPTWESLPIFVGTIYGDRPGEVAVRSAQADVAARLTDVFLVNGHEAITLMTRDDWGLNGLHYDTQGHDTQGQVTLGTRFAEAVLKHHPDPAAGPGVPAR